METLTIVKTMSSREIAEVTGKEHKNVLRDCDTLNEYYEIMFRIRSISMERMRKDVMIPA